MYTEEDIGRVVFDYNNQRIIISKELSPHTALSACRGCAYHDLQEPSGCAENGLISDADGDKGCEYSSIIFKKVRAKAEGSGDFGIILPEGTYRPVYDCQMCLREVPGAWETRDVMQDMFDSSEPAKIKLHSCTSGNVGVANLRGWQKK